MGVDFLVCEHCGEAFPDCGHYVSCQSCGTHWCSDECAAEDGYVTEHCKKHPDLDDRDLMKIYRESHCNFNDCCDCEYYEPDSCKYCRNEDYADFVLLNKALELLKMNREELIEIVNKEKEG